MAAAFFCGRGDHHPLRIYYISSGCHLQDTLLTFFALNWAADSFAVFISFANRLNEVSSKQCESKVNGTKRRKKEQ